MRKNHFFGMRDDVSPLKFLRGVRRSPLRSCSLGRKPTRAQEFNEQVRRVDRSRCGLAWDRMFSASTSSRFKENSTDAPGPGAYNTSNNWEDMSGPGVLASKSDRFASRGALLNPPPSRRTTRSHRPSFTRSHPPRPPRVHRTRPRSLRRRACSRSSGYRWLGPCGRAAAFGEAACGADR